MELLVILPHQVFQSCKIDCLLTVQHNLYHSGSMKSYSSYVSQESEEVCLINLQDPLQYLFIQFVEDFPVNIKHLNHVSAKSEHILCFIMRCSSYQYSSQLNVTFMNQCSSQHPMNFADCQDCYAAMVFTRYCFSYCYYYY